MVSLIGTTLTSNLVIMSGKEELASICPACGKGKLIIRSMIYSVPFFNELAMFNMTCPECGYHNSCLRCGDNQGFCEACGFDIYEYLANKEKQKP